MGDIEDYISHESNLNYKSIYCEKIPELFLDKLVAKKHFNKFGKVTRFILRPKRLCCTVEYDTEDQAENALLNGGNFNGIEFSITYAEREVAHVQNTEEWVDPDVQAELDAMNPTQRGTTGGMSFRSSMPAPAAKFAQPAPPPPSRFPTSKQPSSAKPLPKSDIEVQKVDPAVRQELEATLKRPAFSVEDKYRVLDARDKLIRLMTVRQTDIKKAVSAKGTCPDMCPEKERLMRDFQRQVASFEMATDTENSNNSTISHSRAIKEYSRSSADQEVPLSHELRSERVLQMTMLYLMHRIMDLCDDEETSLADWFHFVWDRTRSIRKDITQQELCSLASVQLVEQCARFHIHCAARLVAEEPSVFDKKINAENLTKCLQTLKYMYHDLRQKGVFCPCEAEFRSYIVLLNLGDANFLWELKQLPEQIQNSQEIRHALNFYNALQNNNFVRFFNLIRSRETSYLSACILLRYFNKLRLRAMEAIIKSHKGKQDVFLPLVYITRVLGFEDDLSAASFLAYHGLQCDEERVLLDRLSMPDLEYSMERALQLVESKRTVSVGECICGHTLESASIFEQHQPQNSFDANGYLKAEAWPAGLLPSAKPTNDSSASLFKVPQASAPISPKQQQQLKLQQHQQQQQELRHLFETRPAEPSKPIAAQQPTPFANKIFGSQSTADNSAGGIFSLSKNSSTSTESSIFKVPSFTVTPTPKQFATPAVENIFTQKAPESKLPAGNIFGAVKKANIFEKPAQESATTLCPPPPAAFKQDNLFQHFQTQPTAAWTLQPNPAPPPPSTNIFGNSRDPRLRPHPKPSEISAQQSEEAAKRMRELEEEKRIKEQQLAERAKLKAMEEERERARRAMERRQQLAVRAQQLADLELDHFVGQEVERIAHAEVSKYRKLNVQSQQLADTLLNQVVQVEIRDIATREHAAQCRNQQLLQRFFRKWLHQVHKKQTQRKIMASMPVWITAETLEQKTANMQHPCQSLNLSMIKRYRHGEPVNFKNLLWQATPHQPEVRLNLCKLMAEYSGGPNFLKPGCLQLRKYYKLLLTLPTDAEEMPGFESLCCKWLQKHVQQPEQRSSQTPEAFLLDMHENVALCLRKITGITPRNEKGQRLSAEGDHVDGILCLMSGQQLRNTRQRLFNLFRQGCNLKPVPVAFVAYDCQYDATQLMEALELETLIVDEHIAAYEFFGCLELKNQFSFISQLSNAIRFLAHSNKRDADAAARGTLEMQRFHSWLDASIGEELWLRWHKSTQENPAFAKLCSMPQHVIGLYNEAIKQLQAIVREDLSEYPEFPKELLEFVPKVKENVNMPLTLPHFPPNWKSLNKEGQLVELLQQLQLPACSLPIPEDVESLEIWLLNYAGDCIPSDDFKSTGAAHDSIKSLVQQLNRADLRDLEVNERLPLVNQLNVIKALVYAYVTHQLNGLKLPTHTIYNRAKFEQYQKQPWWLNYAPIGAVSVDYSLSDISEASESSEEATDMPDMAEIVARAEQAVQKAEHQLSAIKHVTLNPTVCELKRQLDESFYQFDLAKQFGYFDVQSDDENEEPANAAAKSPLHNTKSPLKKRKRATSLETERIGDGNDLDDIIAKAMNVIEKIESREDRHARLKRTAQFLEILDEQSS